MEDAQEDRRGDPDPESERRIDEPAEIATSEGEERGPFVELAKRLSVGRELSAILMPASDQCNDGQATKEGEFCFIDTCDTEMEQSEESEAHEERMSSDPQHAANWTASVV